MAEVINLQTLCNYFYKKRAKTKKQLDISTFFKQVTSSTGIASTF